MLQCSLLRRSVPVAILTFCYAALAQAPAAGEYVGFRGSGRLAIAANGHFTLESYGANGHECHIEGDIRNGSAKLDPAEAGAPNDTCVVSFAPSARGLRVSADGTGQLGCASFCGARAGIKGEYLQPAASCIGPARTATRRKFSKLYSAKSYEQAAAELRLLLAQCLVVMNLVEEAQVRNDLAITEYHLRQYTACLDTLGPIVDAARNAEEQKESLEFESYQPIARATRYNVKLCRQAGR